ncbi:MULTISPECIES: amidase [unclassified Gordonia (in: high G+C Gram-positive bacteria)]|uniref:amidase n=1 Tax=unclassified Gordonia (in: high G+C Gram-positive bacteria) TaxID=2657482 RepID=UPI0009AD44B1|nr:MULTISPECIES: amidase [unclassified Gordonia (in: high G+C Gram-positive bacteria)]MDF3281625.1 amidase [Gordonia sp. N1V]OPX13653.1 hypothetical protein B1964_19135 [Gordonia sp. i37]
MSTHDRITDVLACHEEYVWTNCMVHFDPYAIRAAAASAPPGPLHGLQFSVKDLFAVRGVPSRAGSLVLQGYRPTVEATAVARARQAGAVFVGKSNCAEFGFGIDTETRLGGRVLHPFRDDLSPGGSSGGDAVAVATGIADFAIAGDYGGSARWPAQALGIHGLRTGIGAVPLDGRIGGLGATRRAPTGSGSAPWRLNHLETVSVMARDPQTLRRATDAVCDFRIPRARTRRLLLSFGTEIAPISREVRAAVVEVAARATERGYTVDMAEDVFAGAIDTYNLLRARLDDQSDVAAVVRGNEDLLCDQTREVLADAPGHVVIDDEIRDAWTTALRLRERLREAMTSYDAILMPCAAAGALPFGAGVEVDGVRVEGHALMAHLRAVSLTALPAMTMPVDGERAISVQLVGAPGGELDLCDLAQALAATTGQRTLNQSASESTLHSAGRRS